MKDNESENDFSFLDRFNWSYTSGHLLFSNYITLLLTVRRLQCELTIATLLCHRASKNVLRIDHTHIMSVMLHWIALMVAISWSGSCAGVYNQILTSTFHQTLKSEKWAYFGAVRRRPAVIIWLLELRVHWAGRAAGGRRRTRRSAPALLPLPPIHHTRRETELEI